jgi:hypothetical protein
LKIGVRKGPMRVWFDNGTIGPSDPFHLLTWAILQRHSYSGDTGDPDGHSVYGKTITIQLCKFSLLCFVLPLFFEENS